VNVIGTRHGEKLYEALLSREEMACAEDMGDYFRVPPTAAISTMGNMWIRGSSV
jgi:UDP-glucose 4-epimerase